IWFSTKERVLLVRDVYDLIQSTMTDIVVMDSQGRLGKILVGMNRALGESESISCPDWQILMSQFL
ncbi:hypothetical protein ACEN88_35645, partial [Massilia sp. CT11-108]|uniref:hypothetical protein n=1 Tax=Massilia sp. CT11-108 TaxID=3393900 RepID=UPI0039A45122